MRNAKALGFPNRVARLRQLCPLSIFPLELSPHPPVSVACPVTNDLISAGKSGDLIIPLAAIEQVTVAHDQRMTSDGSLSVHKKIRTQCWVAEFGYM